MKKEVTMTIDFGFLSDPAFKAKLPLLLIFTVLFAFSAVMLARSSLNLTDIFDIPRYEFNIAKLYSVSFILFIVLFSITIALATIYGYNSSIGASLVPLPLLAFVSLVIQLLTQGVLTHFLILALSVTTASFAGSRLDRISMSSVWGAAGKATAVMLLLLFVYVVATVNANKELYFDSLILGASELAPQFQQQVGQACGGLILGAVEENFNEEAVSKTLKESLPRDTVKSNLIALCPQLSNLDSTQQETLVDAAYTQYTLAAVGLLSSLTDSLKTAIEGNGTTEVSTEDVSARVAEQAADIKQKVLDFPGARSIYDNLHFLIGLLVLSTAYVSKFVIQLLASIVAMLVAKI